MKSSAFGWSVPFLALAFAGCDTAGDYEERVSAAASAAPRAAAGGGGALHADATPINGADGKPLFTIKLPSFFSPAESQWMIAGGKDKNGKDITADRANPPGVPLPGWAAAYETFVESAAGQKLPVYVYFAGTALAPGDPVAQEANATAQLTPSLTQLKGGQAAAWAPRPVGQTVWSHTSATGVNMPFDGTQAGGADVTVPGRLDIFCTTTGSHVVFVAWRCPNVCEARCGFEGAMSAALGSVVPSVPKAAPPPGPAAPAGS